ncbi:Chorion peroxidase [Portunus trituberculatus]|uniref:Chorion peroxidase n=1 Tax=Portunus trituberculatus TaxID=210409 RepID=A0A5B7D4F7_PORTR|nr:Chorion peroxidase [Portunus trituberculatus]
MVLLHLVVLLSAWWCPAAPAALPVRSANETPPTASAFVNDSLVRHERSKLTTYGGSVGLSPYYADLQNLPSPTPPMLTTELTPPPPKCMDKETTCDPQARYRTISGRCNNLRNPNDGTPGQAMHTLLPQRYDSPAVFRMRAVGGGLLPNPRHVSLLMSLAPEGSTVQANSLFVQMGQFIDHDFSITTTVREKTPAGKSVEADCKACSSWHKSACAPIPVPLKDPRQPTHLPTGERRSVGYLVKDHQGRRVLSQPNFNTAFLDLSPVYGNDECTAEDMRLHRDGLLDFGENHMLTRRPAEDFPLCMTEARYCLHSGDKR